MSFQRQVDTAGGSAGVGARAGVRWGLALALACLLFPAGALAAPNETRVSSRTDGEGAPNGSYSTAAGPQLPVQYGPVISASGRYVAFGSRMRLTAAPKLGDRADVYVRDHVSATTTLISRASDRAGQPGEQGEGGEPTSISPEGRYVVFISSDGNLVAGDSTGGQPRGLHVFVRDRDPDANGKFEDNATTTLVSRASGDGPFADSTSFGGSISADGRYVAFVSQANNLVEGDTNNNLDVFVRDRKGTASPADDTTELVSRPSDGSPSAGADFQPPPSISADGRYVAFYSEDPSVVAGQQKGVFLRDLQAKTTTFVASTSRAQPSLSADGRFVAFDVPGAQGGVFVRDLRAGTTTPAGPPGAGGTSISPDGRFVSFSTTQALVEDDLNNAEDPASQLEVHPVKGNNDTIPSADVYVRDLQEGTVRMASRSSGVAGASGTAGEGTPGNSHSLLPAMAGGGFVAFQSQASNLVAPDTNQRTDVFRRELPEPPALPSVSVGDVRLLSEGHEGEADATFTVSLSRASGQAVVVDYATADDSATQAEDYTGAGGTLVIPAGERTKTVTVKVKGDTTPEPDERFFVDLSAPRSATIADGQGAGMILNDDGAPPPPPALPSVSIGDVAVGEGDGGEGDAAFTVSLSSPSAQAVAVEYATADDSATQPEDYAKAEGTLSIPAGQRSQTVTVKVKGDTTFEPDERFFVNLSAPQGATIADGQGAGTILNDDRAPAPPPRDDSPPSGGGSTPPGGGASDPPGGSPGSGGEASTPPGGGASTPSGGSPGSGGGGSVPPGGSSPSGGGGGVPPGARTPSAFERCATKYRGRKNAKRRAACVRRVAVRQCTATYRGRKNAKRRAACVRRAAVRQCTTIHKGKGRQKAKQRAACIQKAKRRYR